MSELTAMRNIGREMARKLTAVGIDSPGKLRQVGSKQAYFRIKEVFPNVCLVHLYALEGAVTDRDYNRLPEERKKDLKQFSDVLRGRTQHGTEHEEG
ncbi:TfoX/Sxy family protein [Flintibacter muris]|uniref:TfoX/Sxy family protein n=1 Tax=Flintibacter muris TaxID=2941327 RepID=UPI00203BBA37|nr:TfoX/Sxy family protein [Flintibacter muris]